MRQLRDAIAQERMSVRDHKIYEDLADVGRVRIFMEHHVFAVWDFMNLLKSLQRGFTCVDLPWTPTRDNLSRRLVNEIVLCEESDEVSNVGYLHQTGDYLSHFELYVMAMEQVGADTGPISAFVNKIALGSSVLDALDESAAPLGAHRFVLSTFETIDSGELTAVTAAFCFGREELLPDVFREALRELQVQDRAELTLLFDYLIRHIAVDDDLHSRMAFHLLSVVCETESDWDRAEEAARRSLEARCRLWDDVRVAMNRAGIV